MPTEEECNLFQKELNHVDNKIEQLGNDLRLDINEMRRDFSDYVIEQADRHAESMLTQRLNTEAMKEQTKSTEGLIAAWQAANGAFKFGSWVGRFVLWVCGIFAAIATVMGYTKGWF